MSITKKDTPKNIHEFCERYQNHEFDNSDFQTQVNAGWYDWFCDENELAERLKPMAELLLKIQNTFILTQFHVIFSNKCPIDYPLYDEIAFKYIDHTKCEIYDFGIAFNSPHSGTPISIYTRRNDWNDELTCSTQEETIARIENWATEAVNEEFYKRKMTQELDLMSSIKEGMKVLKEAQDLLTELYGEDILTNPPNIVK